MAVAMSFLVMAGFLSKVERGYPAFQDVLHLLPQNTPWGNSSLRPHTLFSLVARSFTPYYLVQCRGFPSNCGTINCSEDCSTTAIKRQTFPGKSGLRPGGSCPLRVTHTGRACRSDSLEARNSRQNKASHLPRQNHVSGLGGKTMCRVTGHVGTGLVLRLRCRYQCCGSGTQ